VISRYFQKLKLFIFILKQQRWTHIVAPFYTIFTLSLIIAIIYDITLNEFYLSYFVILLGIALCPFFVYLTISIIILLKLLSKKFKNIDKTNNTFLLHSSFYNLLWLIGMLTFLFYLYIFIFCYIPAIF
jgi:hypothetical protein